MGTMERERERERGGGEVEKWKSEYEGLVEP